MSSPESPFKLSSEGGYLEGFFKREALEGLDHDHKDYSLEGILPELGCEEGLQRMASDILRGKPTDDVRLTPDERFSFLNEWLRFAQSDSNIASQRWASLARSSNSCLADRDTFLLTLWRRIVTGQPPESGFLDYVEQRWCPRDYYERHFFSWFLGRFNLSAARQVFPEARFSRTLHRGIAAAGVLFAIPCLSLSHPGPDLTRGILFALAFLAGLVLLGTLAPRLLGMPRYAYVHSLIPRLAATMSIGYLFLASAPQLVGVIRGSQRPAWHLWLTSAFLLAAAWSYIMLHISRRVHPILGWKALCRRGSDMLALALGYAFVGILPCGPLLFSKALIGSGTAQPRHLVLCAMIALNLGVILQLAWDEKPLTEPL